MDFLEDQLLLVPYRRLVVPRVFPGGGMAEVFVIALRLAFGSLILLTEMAAARFATFERIACQQFAKFEEVGHASSVLQILIEIALFARHTHVLPELFAQATNLLDAFGKPSFRASHAGFIPHNLAERA